MVSKQIVTYIDDINGEPAARTVSFGLDGTSYEIDLTADNVIELTKTFNPYIRKARKVTQKRSVKKSVTSQQHKDYIAVVRFWAKENGIKVAERGRIAQSVIDQYQQAFDNAADETLKS